MLIPVLILAGHRTIAESTMSALQSPAAKEDQSVYIGFTRALATPFQISGGRLEICVRTTPKEGLGDPTEIWEHLFLNRGGTGKAIRILVPNLHSLKGQVIIRTPQEALSFVRLQTSPATFYLFKGAISDHMEVVTKGAITPDFCFGDNNMASSFRIEGLHQGFWGIISQKNAKAVGTSKPVVVPIPKGFRVARWMVNVAHDRTPKLVRIVETVGFDGSYKLEKQETVKQQTPTGILWSRPLFE